MISLVLAGIEGFEPTTIGLTGHRSNHCSYIPIKFSGPQENRTLHKNLAKVSRQPWYMQAQIKTVVYWISLYELPKTYSFNNSFGNLISFVNNWIIGNNDLIISRSLSIQSILLWGLLVHLQFNVVDTIRQDVIT